MALAGLGHPHCEGVVALTGDDETNLDVAMTTALLRPDLPVIARSQLPRRRRPDAGVRRPGGGQPARPLRRPPADPAALAGAYQLMVWLTSAPGTPAPRAAGRAAAWPLGGRRPRPVRPRADRRPARPRGSRSTRRAPEERVRRRARATVRPCVEEADVERRRRLRRRHRERHYEPVARRSGTPGQPGRSSSWRCRTGAANAPLFDAVGVDFGMVPAEVIAHEVLARLANPVLMRFLPRVPRQGEEWSARMVDRLVERCGDRSPGPVAGPARRHQAPALARPARHGGLRPRRPAA